MTALAVAVFAAALFVTPLAAWSGDGATRSGKEQTAACKAGEHPNETCGCVQDGWSCCAAPMYPGGPAYLPCLLQNPTPTDKAGVSTGH